MKNILSASANTISIVQLIAGIVSIIGLFYVDLTFVNILIAILSFYVYSILGISITLHRYYTHKSFEFAHPLLKWLFTLFAILAGRGSPLGWTYVHRLHHKFADTDNDPHSPTLLGFKLFGFKHIEDHSGEMKIFLVKDLMNEEQIFINKYYYGIILLFLLMISLIDIQLIYFVWILPVMIVQMSQNSFNYFAHMHGYRNHETKDDSTNNVFLWPLIMGDAWHNNHHKNQKSFDTKEKWWEFDPAAQLIRIIKK
jgi:stearoyl-CoA desaturase (delta-9 desaturase)